MALKSSQLQTRQCLGLFSALAGDLTFCRFGDWKAVFRRTTLFAKPPLFRPF
jgi:hypothetical protein